MRDPLECCYLSSFWISSSIPIFMICLNRFATRWNIFAGSKSLCPNTRCALISCILQQLRVHAYAKFLVEQQAYLNYLRLRRRNDLRDLSKSAMLVQFSSRVVSTRRSITSYSSFSSITFTICARTPTMPCSATI